ncbi:MAG TPA: methylated-DNA--[protein]-cysteine S-methyltransferase [Humibacillus xanthopallidus]|nr:methylated-DNA--[protein]-cysteine S-methyltransferase [Humibacillus xanthopallidus]
MSDNLINALASPADSDTVGADVALLHDRLIESASATGSLDLTYRVVDSPVGRLLLAATEVGLTRLAFEREDHDAVLDSLATHIGPRILHDDKRFDEIARELEDYFDGRRHTFDVPIDLRLSRGFRLEVLRHLRDIPFGRTESYAQVAASAGNAKAVRAVGSACATNPIPIVVPCHRVVRSDGGLGGYLGGTAAKRLLLDIESAA